MDYVSAANIKGNSLLSIATSTQEEMERIYAKNQLVKRIRQEFIDAGAEKALADINIKPDFGLDLMAQMVIHKRATLETLVGLLKGHFIDEDNHLQACADALYEAAKEDIVDIDRSKWIVDYKTKKEIPQVMFVVRYEISSDVQRELDLYQYPLPMVEEPVILERNTDTGYVTLKGSVILKKNHHDDDACLDHINRVNSIALRVNEDTVAFVANRWKNLDKLKPGETYDDFQKRKKAFQKYDRTSRDVIAAMMAQGNRFWITHKYDKRGRVYCQGYAINYQGNDWNKAVVEFADKETLNPA